jgi:hypothetical protein
MTAGAGAAGKDPLTQRLDAIEEKLDRLIAVTEHAQGVVDSFLNGKNAKYLALFAKARGGKL